MQKHYQLFLLSLAVFLLMTGDGMVLALLPKVVITQTNSSASVWYLAAAYALAQVLSQLPVGLLADRWGSKPFILLGYMLSTLAGLLFYFTNNVYLLLLGRVLQGIGEAPLLSLVPALLSVRYFANKGKAIGVYNAAIYLGLTLGPGFRVLLLKDWSDQQVFLLYAVFCFISMLIIGYGLQPSGDRRPTTGETISPSDYLLLIKNPQLAAVLWGITLYGAGFGLFMTVIPAFLLTVKGYSQASINLFFSAFYIAISLAQLTIGYLSDRLGRLLFMVTGMLVAAAGIAAAVYFHYFALTLILCFASFGLGAYYLASMAFLTERVPAGCKGAIAGIYYLFWGIGMFWGPMLLSGYIQATGYQSGFQLFSVMLLLQVILLLMTKSTPARLKSLS
ncbi:MFS transporter [Sporomusa termitida]|uniref:Multidrug resistance protein n=1 Tax=Sporomusa termitida TaxID=2377 RepID=A0A517DW21_9FIRM|nr:MFS transporter [Sporomusa termitida]QDR81555.1 multidrug resistance protein [Sporomusa termitida]